MFLTKKFNIIYLKLATAGDTGFLFDYNEFDWEMNLKLL